MAPAWQFGLVGVLAVAFVTDWKYYKIYNWLTFPAMLVGLLLSVIMGGFAGLTSSLIGFAIGFAIFAIGFFFVEGMGGGDVKLVSAIGLWLGFPGVMPALLYSTALGGVASLIIALRYGSLRKMLRNVWLMVAMTLTGVKPVIPESESAAPKFAYGLYLAIGTFIALLFPEPKDLFAFLGLG